MLSRFLTRREQLILVSMAAAIVLGSLSLYLHSRREQTEPAPVVTPPPETPVAPVAEAAPEPGATIPPLPVADEPPEPAPPQSVAVAVAGAVFRPGLYEFHGPARVQDLLDRAGGVAEGADLSDINRAAALIDGTTLTVPEKGGLEARRGSDTLVLRRGEPVQVHNPPQYTNSGWRAAAPAAAGGASPGETRASAVAPSGDGLIDLNTATQAQLESLPGIGPKLSQDIIRYREETPFKTVDDVMNVSGIGEKRCEAIRPLVTVRP